TGFDLDGDRAALSLLRGVSGLHNGCNSPPCLYNPVSDASPFARARVSTCMSTDGTTPALERPARLMSLDAYRGFIMLMMASSGFGFARVAGKEEFAGNAVWQFLGFQFEHVTWTGCA